jgi:hypothetical protein
MSSRGCVRTTGGTELFPFHIFSGNLSFTTLDGLPKKVKMVVLIFSHN